jgi:predicted peptidase
MSGHGRTWPTIVFFHGSGQAGSGTGAALDSVAVNGLPRLYEVGIEPAVAAGFVVLVPQNPDTTNSPPRVRLWLDEVLPRYAVDRDRLYLTGLSQGGFGVFDYLGAYGDSNEFAAMVPIAGGFNRAIRCADWTHTPLWAFHGEADPRVNVSGSINTVGFVNANCAPSERLRVTTYPGVGHDSWDLTYGLSGMAPGLTNPARDAYDVDIYTWMLAHVRSQTR